MITIRNQSVEVVSFKLGRNRSWRASARLGLRAGLLWAPTTLYRTLRFPVVAVVGGTGLIVVGLLAWLATRTVIVIAGLCGFITKD